MQLIAIAATSLDGFWITLEPRMFGSGTPLLHHETNTTLILKESVDLGPSTLLLKYRVRMSE